MECPRRLANTLHKRSLPIAAKTITGRSELMDSAAKRAATAAATWYFARMPEETSLKTHMLKTDVHNFHKFMYAFGTKTQKQCTCRVPGLDRTDFWKNIYRKA